VGTKTRFQVIDGACQPFRAMDFNKEAKRKGKGERKENRGGVEAWAKTIMIFLMLRTGSCFSTHDALQKYAGPTSVTGTIDFSSVSSTMHKLLQYDEAINQRIALHDFAGPINTSDRSGYSGTYLSSQKKYSHAPLNLEAHQLCSVILTEFASKIHPENFYNLDIFGTKTKTFSIPPELPTNFPQESITYFDASGRREHFPPTKDANTVRMVHSFVRGQEGIVLCVSCVVIGVYCGVPHGQFRQNFHHPRKNCNENCLGTGGARKRAPPVSKEKSWQFLRGWWIFWQNCP
jgi:hypothetical protein